MPVQEQRDEQRNHEKNGRRHPNDSCPAPPTRWRVRRSGGRNGRRPLEVRLVRPGGDHDAEVLLRSFFGVVVPKPFSKPGGFYTNDRVALFTEVLASSVDIRRD